MSIQDKYTANTIPIKTLLEKLGESLKQVGKTTRWQRHLSVSMKDNLWYQHSQKRGGLPIDFLIIFFNYSEYEAIDFILNNLDDAVTQTSELPPDSLYRPPQNYNHHAVSIYLKHFRFIDENVINDIIKQGVLYEERNYKNCIFVGQSPGGSIKHIHRHSTHLSNELYKGNTLGSDSRYSFNIPGTSESLYVFEAPIDLLSFITLNPEHWKEHSYLALCGLSSQSLHQYLSGHEHIVKVYLCLDNDIHGFKATASIIEELQLHTHYEIQCIRPRFKDFNEDLKFIHGHPVIDGIYDTLKKSISIATKFIAEAYSSSKDKSLKDLMNQFSSFYYTYNSPILKKQEQAYQSLLDCAGYALLLARQQYRHLELSYSLGELLELIQVNDTVMHHIDTNADVSQFTKELNIIKNIFLTKTFHTVDDKHQLIQSLMSLAKLCIYTHVFYFYQKGTHLYESK
ncbi:toprim domain-containing protein [Erysipelothrix anatis]|uniref:toprim domain-containing protein n=1 Tax=Erysipelothrix anatis TaxID=2683713 RepID=UPI00140CBD7B|nr:toprim domain-containing protein [Erysipelothrix anatis]